MSEKAHEAPERLTDEEFKNLQKSFEGIDLKKHDNSVSFEWEDNKEYFFDVVVGADNLKTAIEEKLEELKS